MGRKKPFILKSADQVDFQRDCRLCGRPIIVVTPKKESESDKPVAIDKGVPTWWKDSTTGRWLRSRTTFMEHRFV